MSAATTYAPRHVTYNNGQPAAERFSSKTIASASNLSFTAIAEASTQHARCSDPLMIKSARTKTRYPLWAFLFVFVLPPFALHAALSGRAGFVERPKPLDNIADAAPTVEQMLVEPFLVDTVDFH